MKIDNISIKNYFFFLKKRTKYIKNFFNYEKKIFDIIKIKKELENPSIWKKIEYLKKIKKKLTYLEFIVFNFQKIIQNLKDIYELFQLAILENDYNFFSEIVNNLQYIEKKIRKLENLAMFSGINDKCYCYVNIQAGSGGNEAQDWANMLLKMYLKWSENKKFKTKILEESINNIAGIKSATIYVQEDYAYGWLRTETGIHRLVRKSPFDTNKRRHTSFSSVFVYPEINKKINIDVNPSELRIDVYRASGSGGQHVNRTESAVRITHIPTNTVTQCQNDRSQHRNKNQAMKQMKEKLYKLEIQKQKNEKKILEKSKSDINWGHQIRSYILDDSRIKDLRSGLETRNIQSILNGNLDFFIIENLKLGL